MLKKPDSLFTLKEEQARLVVTSSGRARAYYVNIAALFLALALAVTALYVALAWPMSQVQWGLVTFLALAPVAGVVLLYALVARQPPVVFDRATDRVLLGGKVLGPLGNMDALGIHTVDSLDSRRTWVGLTVTFHFGRSKVLLKQEAPASELNALADTLAARLGVPLRREEGGIQAAPRADQQSSPYAWLVAAAGFLVSILLMVPETMLSVENANCLDQPVKSQAVPPSDKLLYFIPTDEFPGALMQDLVAYYRHKFDLSPTVLPAMSLEQDMWDSSRQQYIAEQLVGALKRRHARLAERPDAVLIVLTTEDIYIQSFTWRYAYAYRTEGRFAVVSTARMDPAFSPWRWLIGESDERGEEDQKLLTCRLKKMVSKQIGLLYYGLSESADERSVLYSPMMGPDDLDRVGEDF